MAAKVPSQIPHKILIIRLSSLGDIIQCLYSAYALHKQNPNSEIHWVVRSDMAELLTLSPYIHKVWTFERSKGLRGWIQLSKELQKQNFDFVYDAHNNVRSRIMTPFISAQKFARRPKSRWKRVLEFKLGMPQFPQPFRGAHSFVTPLEEWGVRIPKEQGKWLEVSESQIAEIKSKINLPKHYVTFAPSAAWEMKRWPISHWEKLIQMWKASPIVLLGGQNDHFIKDLARENEVINLAGKTSLMESAFIIAGSDQVVSADTGLLHIADGLGIPCMALIGPTAFGFPSHPHSKILEVDLSCRPCSKDGRGRCKQKVYQRCMVDISPQRVWEEMQP